MGLLFKSFAHVATLLAAGLLCGCSIASGPSSSGLLLHRSLIDFTGLAPLVQVASIKISAAPPAGWERMPTKTTPLYTHDQWRSPSTHTGVGVAFVHLPLPLSSDTIAWFAKQEYNKKSKDGKVLGQWTDAVGRTCFEAENEKYHIRGYVIARGLDAWIIYCGYRLNNPPEPDEISLALRSVETIVPITLPASVAAR